MTWVEHVSTAMVGSPKAGFMRTFAVLRADAGKRFERRARVRYFTAVLRKYRP